MGFPGEKRFGEVAELSEKPQSLCMGCLRQMSKKAWAMRSGCRKAMTRLETRLGRHQLVEDEDDWNGRDAEGEAEARARQCQALLVPSALLPAAGVLLGPCS